jgi:hypothetical protein
MKETSPGGDVGGCENNLYDLENSTFSRIVYCPTEKANNELNITMSLLYV